ncbi:MAG: BrnT family toxin [Eubacteriales bacterium]|nr:BrnT family toxin [Eubacteriales bacterium]
MLQFEWDENKNTINKKKHGISFEEAETAFYDDEAVVIPDPEHSQDEERFILLGFSAMARLLMVCHCIRGEDDIIRIISARKATRIETEQYTEMEV